MARIARYLAVVAATVGGSFATFALLLRLYRPGWESHEYQAIAFWSVPLAVLVLALAKVGRRWLGARPVVIRLLAAGVTAIGAAIAWTYAAVALTGGYALAFDANPFYCWLVGSLLGTAAAQLWPRRPPRPASTV
jgi:hypothetical protein